MDVFQVQKHLAHPAKMQKIDEIKNIPYFLPVVYLCDTYLWSGWLKKAGLKYVIFCLYDVYDAYTLSSLHVSSNVSWYRCLCHQIIHYEFLKAFWRHFEGKNSIEA